VFAQIPILICFVAGCRGAIAERRRQTAVLWPLEASKVLWQGLQVAGGIISDVSLMFEKKDEVKTGKEQA
jgi:hypothetical protein